MAPGRPGPMEQVNIHFASQRLEGIRGEAQPLENDRLKMPNGSSDGRFSVAFIKILT